eukprot:SAG31_NODE_24854_length_473_cov_0.759358_1_plen_23_part_01
MDSEGQSQAESMPYRFSGIAMHG